MPTRGFRPPRSLRWRLTGWVAARISGVHPVIPMIRTASFGALAMAITYLAGRVLYP